METEGLSSHKFWAWIVLLFLSVNGLITCNLISFSFVVLSSICFYIWAQGKSIEGGFFKVISFLSMTLAFIYVIGIFILRIKWLEYIDSQDWVFIVGLTWDDPNGKDNDTYFKYGIASLIIALAQFVSNQVYFKAYSSF
jgi:hypothetical protein